MKRSHHAGGMTSVPVVTARTTDKLTVVIPPGEQQIWRMHIPLDNGTPKVVEGVGQGANTLQIDINLLEPATAFDTWTIFTPDGERTGQFSVGTPQPSSTEPAHKT